MITKIHMIILLEHDLDAAVAFYQSLGLKLIFRMKGKWAEFTCGDVKVGLCPTDDESSIVRHSGIVLEVADVRAFYEQHKADLAFLGEPIEKAHGIMISIKDPGNNSIDIYQPTPEKLQELIKQVKERGEQEDACCGGPKGEAGDEIACCDDEEACEIECSNGSAEQETCC